MNKNCFRLIFSKTLGCLIPVAEICTSKRKSGQTKGPSADVSSRWALKALPLALLGVLPQAFAQIVIAPHQHANMTQSQHGVPVLEIADPNRNGLSHNRLDEFNVVSPGLIFNNSMRDGTTVIGGHVMHNPNLTSEARAILTEVTGNDTSSLAGTLEVFGRSADLFIVKKKAAMPSLAIEAGDIKSTKFEDKHKTSFSREEIFVGMESEVHSSIANVASNINKTVDKSNDGMSVDPGLTTAAQAGNATQLAFGDTLGASTFWGASHTKTETNSETRSENINQIGGNIKLTTTKGDIELKGVNIQGGKVEVDSAGKILQQAAESSSNSSSSTDIIRAGITGAASVGPSGSGIGASVGADGSHDRTTSSSTSFTNGLISGSEVIIRAKGDHTMEGANIKSDHLDYKIDGTQTITTKQNTSNMDHEHGKWSAAVGIAISSAGIVPVASVSGSGGKDYDNSRLTGEQSGISTGSLNMHVGGDQKLTGAHVTSASGEGSYRVEGQVIANDLKDSRNKDGGYGGGGGGISKSGVPTVVVEGGRVDQIKYEANQKSTVDIGGMDMSVGGGVVGNLNRDSSKQVEVINDTKVAGTDIRVEISSTGGGKKKGDVDVPGGASRPTTSAPDAPTSRPTTPAPDYPTSRPTTPAPDYPGARPTTPAPDYPGARPTTPAPDYPGARPTTPAPDYPGARPVEPSPDYPGARPVEPAPDYPVSRPDEPAVDYPHWRPINPDPDYPGAPTIDLKPIPADPYPPKPTKPVAAEPAPDYPVSRPDEPAVDYPHWRPIDPDPDYPGAPTIDLKPIPADPYPPKPTKPAAAEPAPDYPVSRPDEPAVDYPHWRPIDPDPDYPGAPTIDLKPIPADPYPPKPIKPAPAEPAPDYTGVRPVEPAPDYPVSRPDEPAVDYPHWRPIDPDPDYPGAPTIDLKPIPADPYPPKPIKPAPAEPAPDYTGVRPVEPAPDYPVSRPDEPAVDYPHWRPIDPDPDYPGAPTIDLKPIPADPYPPKPIKPAPAEPKPDYPVSAPDEPPVDYPHWRPIDPDPDYPGAPEIELKPIVGPYPPKDPKPKPPAEPAPDYAPVEPKPDYPPVEPKPDYPPVEPAPDYPPVEPKPDYPTDGDKNPIGGRPCNVSTPDSTGPCTRPIE